MNYSIEDLKCINNKIEEIINSPIKNITKKKAKKVLKNCGILNKKNKVKSIYKNIIREEM